jgi:hypothetical protein
MDPLIRHLDQATEPAIEPRAPEQADQLRKPTPRGSEAARAHAPRLSRRVPIEMIDPHTPHDCDIPPLSKDGQS